MTLIYDTTRAGGGGLPRWGGQGVSKFCLKSCKLKMFQFFLTSFFLIFEFEYIFSSPCLSSCLGGVVVTRILY